ncbi:STAS domain-containing protein [Domibacillus sp. DTU_2020_1001157_1_SI_ALB_TIR_016]|uniref:STAS domain-containing protein n=1 Tax=Domibacillus sp. DTU_2020_1001157_1_SI_ALB_TIR_016 TaxID=3077789 RepID=UPI0028E56B81|nr:STAS domain-containing protein [Domibacillus sp. DTU_2020_1001157_1_SI_ALB_TIR_016]WNS80292.1 STAS domain-containing protein [Domibacillus sp. DTU_2020_1001157_1_SI_ALB_TIR_016]
MAANPHITIGGLEFEWDLEKGRFIFEREDAVLFWISSAMRTFFDTIEEISGEEASNLVFETTGFRQGLVVGQYFEKIKDVNAAQAAELITNTYASAGWGRTTIQDLNFEAKTLTAFIKDSWEYKINKAQAKRQGGNYLPAHYAGIFTGLFGENIWYEVVQDQLDGHEHSIIKYFPSDVTISNNIHELARKKEAEEILRLETIVEEKTKELKELVRQLSSPIIPVLEGIVVVPLIGKYDEDRSEELVVKTLNNLPAHKANYLVLDLTGLDKDISGHTVSLIEKIGSAASLIGTETILVGISPELGMVISQSTINLSRFDCFQTLQHGIYFALAQHGRKIV